MRQTTNQQDLNNLEHRFESRLREEILRLDTRVLNLERPTVDALTYTASPNYIPNSHPEWSKLAYTTAATTPSTAGDTNRECYNWYRQTAATTTLAATAANALKRSVLGAQHTLWAANEGANSDIPIWDGVNGTIQLGSSATNYDISCLLPTDFVLTGQRFYIYFELALASTSIAIPSNLQVYAGFWDNTNTDWIKGSAFTPTASVQGVAGARTIEYKIHAKTDTGDEMLSNAVTVTTANATLTPNNRVRLAFSGAPGFIYYGIYRKVGSNYYRVGEIRNSIDLQFYDQVESGATVVSVAGYPSVSGNAPKAYTLSGLVTSLSATGYLANTLSVQVPTTYNRGSTNAGAQWFRFGINQLVAGGSERGFLIRRISVSEGYGGWVRSNRDMTAASPPTATATSSPTPGNPPVDPPPPGSGGNCVTLDTLVPTLNGDKPIGEIDYGELVDNAAYVSPVKNIIQGEVAEVAVIKTANGCALKCSLPHRIITSNQDVRGTAASQLKIGDKVLTCLNGQYAQSEIIGHEIERGSFTVRTLKVPAPHLYITNGIVSHNSKDPNQI